MGTRHKRKRRGLKLESSGYQQGGWSADMFEGYFNQGTKRGRRKQRRLNRLIGRANDGKKGANRKLQEMQNFQVVKDYQNQGYDISGGDPMTGSYMITDPNTGQSFEYNPNIQSGFEKFNSGLSNTISSAAPMIANAVAPGSGAIISGIQRGFNALNGPQPQQMPQNGFQSMGPLGQSPMGMSNPFMTGMNMFGGMFGGQGQGQSPFQVPGINGGMFGGQGQSGSAGLGQILGGFGDILNIAGGLGLFQDGGDVNQFMQQRGFIPQDQGIPDGVRATPRPTPGQFMGTNYGPVATPIDETVGIQAPSSPIDELKFGLLAAESQGEENPYEARNKQTNALGKYQFIPRYHKDAIKDTLGININTEKGKQEFLESPEAQEKYFESYAGKTLQPLVEKMRNKYGRKLDSYTDAEIMSILHYNWTGGVKELARGNTGVNPTEGTGIANTTYGGYLNRVRGGIEAAREMGKLRGTPKGVRRSLLKGKKGGKMKKKYKYQQGGPVGLVDIQAEKGELIFHPTGYLTDVHARKSHARMKQSGNEDMITDHPLEGSFIFSDYLNIERDDAEDLVIGVKRYPYVEGEKGKEPEVYSLGDIFNKRERKKTPAKLAKRIRDTFSVTNDKNDIFNVLGDKLNIQNRLPYLQGVAMLSEIERERDDLEEEIDSLGDPFFAKKGGTMKSRRVYHPLRMQMRQTGGFTRQPGMNPYGDPTQMLPQAGYVFDDLLGADPMNPLPQHGGIGAGVDPMGTYRDYLGRTIPGVSPMLPNSPGIPSQVRPMPNPNSGDTGSNTPFNGNTGQTPAQMMTSYMDFGDPMLRNIGKYAMPIGGGITTGANIAGAIGSYNLYDDLIGENADFFEGQRGLANQSRDIASAGNLFDVGLNFMQQGPVDLESRFSNRLRQFDPYRQVTTARQLGDQSLGQINTMMRGRPNERGLNIGSAIAANNQGIAQATSSAMNQQLQIDQMLDAEDFYNQGVRTGNQQRRVDFGNSLIQGARPGFQGFFTNEASRPMDQLGLNSAERQADIAFRQNRLTQPIQYASAAGNSLSNLGATMYGLGTNYQPVQVPVGGQGGQGGIGNAASIIGGLGNIANTLGQLGVFEYGGRIKRRK